MRNTALPALTGIRFYAALAVYLSHVSIVPGMDRLSRSLLIFNVGVVGVSFFFVLSGFILTYNYSDVFGESLSARTYGNFIRDRLARIYPVHLLMLLVILPVQIYSPNLPLDWRAVPFHLLLLQCFWPLSEPVFFHTLNVPSWSVSCEWFFYLLAPVSMLLVWSRRGRWILIGVLTIYAVALGGFLVNQQAFTRLYLISWFAPSRFVEFVAGVFLARYYLLNRVVSSPVRSIAAQALGFALLVLGAYYRQYAPWPLHGGLLYVCGAILIILGLTDGRGSIAAHLSSPTLTRLGTASFSFYLVHAPVFRITKGVCLKMHWQVDSWTGFAIVASSLFLVVQTTALVLFRYYETPARKWMRRQLRPFGTRLAPA